VLGFLTVVGWQQFADARQSVALESAAAADAWHMAAGLAGAFVRASIPIPQQYRDRTRGMAGYSPAYSTDAAWALYEYDDVICG